MRARLALPTAVCSAVLLALTGCVADGGSTDATHASLTVDSSATECAVSAAEAPAGTVRFRVTNSGDKVTEFYLLADDGLKIVGEAENIGPGLSRDLVVELEAGKYFTSCKPGMTGDGVGKAAFTVTESDAAGEIDARQVELRRKYPPSENEGTFSATERAAPPAGRISRG